MRNGYKVFDADSHVIYPADLWQTWLEPKFAVWDMREDLARWRHPVLFIQGNDDPYGSQGQADAAAFSGHVEVVGFADCAHSPHLEQADKTLSLITKFVSRVLNDA